VKREHAERLAVILGKSVAERYITQEEASMLLKALVADSVPKRKKELSPKKGT